MAGKQIMEKDYKNVRFQWGRGFYKGEAREIQPDRKNQGVHFS